MSCSEGAASQIPEEKVAGADETLLTSSPSLSCVRSAGAAALCSWQVGGTRSHIGKHKQMVTAQLLVLFEIEIFTAN